MKGAYYNEWDSYCVEWLKNLIRAGLIPDGDVDSRSIVDVQPEDLDGYTQCHFFTGVGGWPLALRLAGWEDSRRVWTGSPPCQPFSVAGKQLGTDDARHLWPHYFRLIRSFHPGVLFFEQVAAAIGKNWLDGVFADLEGEGYACQAAVLPACSVSAPHRRDRIWGVAASGALGDCLRPGLEGLAGHVDDWAGWASANRPVAEAGGGGVVADADQPCAREGRQQPGGQFGGACCDQGARSFWHDHAWIIGHDGKARRVPQSSLCSVADGVPTGVAELRAGSDAAQEEVITLLASGVPARVGKLKALGNAIVPQVAAEFIGALMECMP